MRAPSKLVKAFSSIRHNTVRQVPLVGDDGGKPRFRSAIDDVLVRAERAVLVGASMPSHADGFPSSTPGSGNVGGGKGGRQLMRIDGRDDRTLAAGETDRVPTSSTEMAALARPAVDPKARAAQDIVSRVFEVERQLEGLARAVDRFDRLDSTAGVEDPTMCWVAQVRYRLPFDPLWEPFKTTDFATQLAEPFDEPRKVCSFVYWFVRNHRRLPDKAEMLEHLERKTVRIRA